MIDPVRLSALRELESEGSPGVVDALFRSFLNQAGGDLTALASEDGAGDANAVRIVCHRLRGTAATLGVLGVVRVCEELEAAAGRGRPPPELLGRLESELSRVAATVRAWPRLEG
ncbi:MAG: Hpt domain-containing protein [Acidimicrobiales bacterium]